VQTVLAIALLTALSVHAYGKGIALLPEMLWACHVASAAMALGVLLRRARWVEVSFLFHCAMGMPAYVIDVAVHRDTTLSSVAVHILPLLLGFNAARTAGYRAGALAPSAMLYPLLVLVCRILTPRALNVNLAFAPWSQSLFPRIWMWVNLGASVTLLWLTDRALQRLFRKQRL
jgi:hypothetical protein